jgi:hypothetical protein
MKPTFTRNVGRTETSRKVTGARESGVALKR